MARTKKTKEQEMMFKFYSDECTTFPYVRLMKIGEQMTNFVFKFGEFEGETCANTKNYEIYYDTRTGKILNTLQHITFSTSKKRTKLTLGELVAFTDIEGRLKEFLQQ